MIISPNKKKYIKLEKKYKRHEVSNMSPNIKIKWKSAKNFYVYDDDKNKYIDFTSGIFTSNIGYGNSYFRKFVNKAMSNGFNHSYTYYNDYREKYIAELINFINSPKLKKCFLTSAGTESVESSIKLARLFGAKYDKRKIGIICVRGNWHGRTMGSAMLSGKNEQSKWVGFFDKNIFHIDFPYPWLKNSGEKSFFLNSLNKRFGKKFRFKSRISMIMLETFQGWGAIFYPNNYVKAVADFCKKNKILLCFDEMQAGFGRTGKKFGFEHYGVKPDMICCGKGMGSGFPISGVIGSNKIFNNSQITGMSSTHSANPICCSAGIATIKIIKKLNLVKKSMNQGVLMHKKLKLLDHKFKNIILGCYGKGLIGSIIFKNFKKTHSKDIADKVSLKCLKKGLLVCNTGRESIKLGPPLIINGNAIKKAFKIIEKAIEEVFNEIDK